jgi:hypothetical protein
LADLLRHGLLRGSAIPDRTWRELRHLEFLDAEIAALNAEVAARLQPHAPILERLDSIPGVGLRVAE